MDALIEAIMPWLAQANGLTISGGEPFEQPTALVMLLTEIRARVASDFDVLVYTGLPLEAVSMTLQRAEGLIDALMTDPYDARNTALLALRGSDNQRLHLLTELGRARFASFERERTATDLLLDVMFDADGTVWIAGIPNRDDLRRLATLLADTGTTLTTTESISN